MAASRAGSVIQNPKSKIQNCFAVSIALLLLFAASAAAAPAAPAPADNELLVSMPKGEGFQLPEGGGWLGSYVNWYWLALMLGASVLLLWITGWMNHDCERLKIHPLRWNVIGMGASAVALAVFFLVPVWASVPAALAAAAAVLRLYVPERNKKVLPGRRLFTAEHRRQITRRLLGKLGVEPKSDEQRLAAIAREHLPVALFNQAGKPVSPADAPYDEGEPSTFVKGLIAQGVNRHAREIYVVSKGHLVSVGFKVDGVTHAGKPLDRATGRIVMEALSALVRDDSSDPAFSVGLPTLHSKLSIGVRRVSEEEGDAICLRFRRENDTAPRKLETIGLEPGQFSTVKSALESGQGMICVAGPAEMGVRSTLYAMLDSLDPFSRNIATFEKPVRGKLESIEQNDLTKLDEPLPAMLKRKLREDYNLFMFTEVADKPTALVALTARQREQLVLGGFDLPDVFSVIHQLLGLGLDPKVVADGLHTLIAQRLVRVLCEKCRAPVTPSPEFLRKVGLDPDQVSTFYEESAGCAACGATGFQGRTGIFEVWTLSKESRALLASGADPRPLHAAAAHDGMTGLQQAGLAKVVAGVTSLKEAARVLR